MAVPLDSSKPYRFPSELVELAQAVREADPVNESTWIEWKSSLNLDDKAAHQHIAKHVLGFANRTLATAAHHTGGHAYLVIGAEPGALEGVKTVDPAVLRPRIIRYVGPAPRWRAEFVPVEDKVVLVVIADPPEHGDPIHPVRNQLFEHPKGRVLIRHAGSTDPADDHEIDQLVARARAGAERLAVAVEPDVATIEAIPELDFDDLADAERRTTLARPRVNTLGLLAAVPSSLGQPDDRSPEDYQREVDAYIERFKEQLAERYAWRLWRHGATYLRFALTNQTDSNFSNVAVTVHVGGDVKAWPEDLDVEDDEPQLPQRPDVLGTRKPFDLGIPSALLDQLARSSVASLPAMTVAPSFPSYTVENTGSITVTFDPVDLRPEERYVFEPVPVLVKVPAGSTLACEWTATASNVPGRLSEKFSIVVESSTLSLDDLDGR